MVNSLQQAKELISIFQEIVRKWSIALRRSGIADGRGVMSAEEKQACMHFKVSESVLMVGDGINDAQHWQQRIYP